MPTGYAATIQCGNAEPEPYSGGPIEVIAPGPGTTLTCTITNTQLRSTVQIVKQWDGAPSSTTIFVDSDGCCALRRLHGRDRRRDERSFVYPVSTATAVGETPIPTGYSATIDCGDRPPGLHRRPLPSHIAGRTAPPSPARSRTGSYSRPFGWSSNGTVHLPRRRSSSTETGSGAPSMTRQSRPEPGTAPHSTIRSGPR